VSKKKNSLAIGETLELNISGQTHRGWGVARHDGQVIFVPGAIIGEKVSARIMAVKKGIPQAEVLSVLSAADVRVKPDCEYAAVCGGCALRHMDYAAQLEFKRSVVVEQLTRFGGFEAAESLVRPAVGMEKPFNYRNKGVFHAEYEGGKMRLGLLEEGSHELAGDCRYLFPPQLKELANKAAELLNTYPDLCVALKAALLRISLAEEKLMFIAMQKTAAKAKVWQRFFAELQAACPDLSVFGTAVDMGRGRELSELDIYSEAKTLTETLNGLHYRISPASFFQINSEQTAKMLQRLCALAAEVDFTTAIDAYGGIGTIGLQLAAAGSAVTGIEIVPSAVDDYRDNAALNGLQNVECLLGRSEKLFTKAAPEGGSKTLVVVDPPRKGCALEFLQAVIDFAPNGLIYLSCDPATLARDLKILKAGGYEPDFVEPYDFFPHSHHIETLVRLRRK